MTLHRRRRGHEAHRRQPAAAAQPGAGSPRVVSRVWRVVAVAALLWLVVPPAINGGDERSAAPAPDMLFVRAPRGFESVGGAYLLLPQSQCGWRGRVPPPPAPSWVSFSGVNDVPLEDRQWVYADGGRWALGSLHAPSFVTAELPTAGDEAMPLQLPQEVPLHLWQPADGPADDAEACTGLRVSASAPRYDGARSELAVVGVGSPALAGRYLLVEAPDPPTEHPWPTWVRAGSVSTALFSLPTSEGARWALGVTQQLQLPVDRVNRRLQILALSEPHGGWMPYELPAGSWGIRECTSDPAASGAVRREGSGAGWQQSEEPGAYDPEAGDEPGQSCTVMAAPQLAVTERRLPQELFVSLPERAHQPLDGVVTDDRLAHLVEVEGRYVLLEPTSESDPFPQWGCGDLRLRRLPSGGWAVSVGDTRRLRLRTGRLQGRLGGVYWRSNQTANGLPVWTRAGHSGFLYGASNGCWTVTPNQQDVGTDRGYLHSPLHHNSASPVGVIGWKVWDGSVWLPDSSIAVTHDPPGGSEQRWAVWADSAAAKEALHPGAFEGGWVAGDGEGHEHAVKALLSLACPHANPDDTRHTRRCRRQCCPHGVPRQHCTLDAGLFDD
eukprot:TRINITY_DN19281_c0_g1_i1.p1 TRINITY_DN19281_c0_g1~~TRINITY_DN19281_c0_g1_i1.p1  ORF type:complete len:610 (+),score=188.05 TRINITY_DN19281_c0_g1_i1:71-1900(+)